MLWERTQQNVGVGSDSLLRGACHSAFPGQSLRWSYSPHSYQIHFKLIRHRAELLYARRPPMIGIPLDCSMCEYVVISKFMYFLIFYEALQRVHNSIEQLAFQGLFFHARLPYQFHNVDIILEVRL